MESYQRISLGMYIYLNRGCYQKELCTCISMRVCRICARASSKHALVGRDIECHQGTLVAHYYSTRFAVTVARKLGISAAPAMIGWTYRQCRSVPDIDGVVVCQDKATILAEAHEEHEALKAERQEQRRMKRVIDTWKKLVRGVLLRETLERRYGGEASPTLPVSVMDVETGATLSIEHDDSMSIGRQYHEHDYGDESTHEYNGASGLWTKRCKCGFAVTYEKL
jgi:hypothetical protein